jgi:hypothetical protein
MRALVLLLAGSAALGGLWAGVRGARLFVRGVRGADDPSGALWVIRGLRGLIVCICLTCLAAGAVLGERWLLVFAGLWLLEEIYETGVLALILRRGALLTGIRQRAGRSSSLLAAASLWCCPAHHRQVSSRP